MESSLSKITNEPKTDFEKLVQAKLELTSLKKELSSIKIERGKDFSYIEELEETNKSIKSELARLSASEVYEKIQLLDEIEQLKTLTSNLNKGNSTLGAQNKKLRNTNNELIRKNYELSYKVNIDRFNTKS